MARDTIDLSSFMAKVVIVLILDFIAIVILAKIAVLLGVSLVIAAMVGILWGVTNQNDEIMTYSLVEGFVGIVLFIGGSTCLSFIDNNPVGQNYSCAVNGVFTWINRMFGEQTSNGLIGFSRMHAQTGIINTLLMFNRGS